MPDPKSLLETQIEKLKRTTQQSKDRLAELQEHSSEAGKQAKED